MARRLASGRSPFSPDRDHLHHYLSNWMPWERGLAIYLLLIGVPNAVAYLYPQLLTTMIFLTVTIYVVMILVLAREPIAEKRSTVLIGK
jgi:UDP-GlcNAc:undecaprenyl-phosphate GlcNAc-1-phosphate transferase